MRHLVLCLTPLLAACSDDPFAPVGERVYAPGVASRGETVDQLLVGHRLMASGEYELARQAYLRATAERGFNADTLSALGSANLRLGRLNQAEALMRRAVDEDPEFPAAWNNLGVVLMEKGEFAEARQVFRRAFATSNGESDEIRDNLKLAIANLNNPGYDPQNDSEFKLVAQGGGRYLILQTP
ncbi:tetratricopeptide repeat protein [Aestuariibius sp. 2305UL40-4]|uniref:tetratricopeptide repeat protein n=1 Tax=Aestuariibius violaceus TaxID=3234132 RepID=UPI00345E1981